MGLRRGRRRLMGRREAWMADDEAGGLDHWDLRAGDDRSEGGQ